MSTTSARPRARQVLALAASTVLVTGAVCAGSVAGTPPADGAKKIEKSYHYKCSIRAGGFGISPAKVKVTVRAKLPGSVEAGSKIGRRPIAVTLRMPEAVRVNAVDILHARKARGRAVKPYVGVKIDGTHYRVPIKGLNSKKARIPRKSGSAWKIRAKGTVAPVKVPRSAGGKAKVSVPKRLKVKAKLYRKNGSKIKASMKCKAPKDRGFGTVRITH